MAGRKGARARQERFSGRVPQTRKEITVEAARIMAEEGIQDFQTAKRKAAGRLNLPDTKDWPSNQEVESAFQERLELFHSELPALRHRLRSAAVEAMHFLHEFEPRLVGMVLSGHVTKFTPIQLHVAADAPEEIVFFLDAHGVPYEEADKRLRFGGDRVATVPAFRFHAGDALIELHVFTREGIRETPLSPIDGRPMRRANLKEVEALLASPG